MTRTVHVEDKNENQMFSFLKLVAIDIVYYQVAIKNNRSDYDWVQFTRRSLCQQSFSSILYHNLGSALIVKKSSAATNDDDDFAVCI